MSYIFAYLETTSPHWEGRLSVLRAVFGPVKFGPFGVAGKLGQSNSKTVLTRFLDDLIEIFPFSWLISFSATVSIGVIDSFNKEM